MFVRQKDMCLICFRQFKIASSELRWTYNWVSSAKKWYLMQEWFPIILLSGVVYSENKRGPRTEPWGTPYVSFENLDRLAHADQSLITQ